MHHRMQLCAAWRSGSGAERQGSLLGVVVGSDGAGIRRVGVWRPGEGGSSVFEELEFGRFLGGLGGAGETCEWRPERPRDVETHSKGTAATDCPFGSAQSRRRSLGVDLRTKLGIQDRAHSGPTCRARVWTSGNHGRDQRASRAMLTLHWMCPRPQRHPTPIRTRGGPIPSTTQQGAEP